MLMTLLELEKMGCLFRVGSDVKPADQDKQGTVRILYLADIGEFSVCHRTERFLTTQKAKTLKYIFLKSADILIARCPHPLGRTSLFEPSKGECVTIGDVLIFRNVLKQVDSRYLCYYLNSPNVRAQINTFSKGSFRDRISKEQIGSIKVHLPTIEVQQRVASEIKFIFGECDSAIAEIQKINRMIEHYRESILNSAIQGHLVPSNNLAVSKPDASLPNTDMPFALPPTWTWVRLGQLLLFSLNPCVDKSRHLTSDIQMLGIDYIRTNAYNFSPIEKTNKPHAFEPHLEAGDLLFYCSNHKVNLKRCIVFKGDPALVHCQHDLFRLRFDQKCIEPHFMAVMINAIFDSHWLKTSRQPISTITLRTLCTLPIALPPYADQKRIVAMLQNTLDPLKTHIDTLLAQTKNLHFLKEQILNQFFKEGSI
jgi:hypothetical protein